MHNGRATIRTLVIGFLALVALLAIKGDRDGDRLLEETRIVCGAADVATDPTRAALCAVRAARR